METWKEIEDTYYEVSNNGRVKSNSSRPCILKLRNDKYGYKRVTLHRGSVLATVLIHRLVASHHIPNPDGKPCVNHIDGDKANNYVSNLEWCTHSENTIHSIKIGTTPNREGVNNGRATLTADEVKRIRASNRSIKALSLRFKVSYGIIYRIKNNITYKEI